MADDTISDASDTNTTTEEHEVRQVPVTALQDERAKRQALEERLAAMEQAQQEAARKAAEEQGEFRKLYEEAAPQLEAYKAQIAEFQAKETARVERVSERNAKRVAELPDSIKALVPESFDADSLAAWLDKVPTTTQQRPAGTQTHGGGSSGGIPADKRAQVEADAKARGKDPDWWYSVMKDTLYK